MAQASLNADSQGLTVTGFASTSSGPTADTRTVTFTLVDGSGGGTDTVARVMQVENEPRTGAAANARRSRISAGRISIPPSRQRLTTGGHAR